MSQFIFSKLYQIKPKINNLGKTIDIYLPGNLSKADTGVYVWGFKFRDNSPSGRTRFLPYYVGKADGHTIIQRLKSHYCFDENYNVFKEKYLPEYFKYLESDLTVQKKMLLQEYIIYNEWFAYLNTGNENLGALGNYGEAFDKLQIKRNDKNIASAIQYYQDNFYACWIVEPINKNNPIIPSLERHINYHFPHSPIGRPGAENNPSFEINEEALGDDRFLIEKGWKCDRQLTMTATKSILI